MRPRCPSSPGVIAGYGVAASNILARTKGGARLVLLVLWCVAAERSYGRFRKARVEQTIDGHFAVDLSRVLEELPVLTERVDIELAVRIDHRRDDRLVDFRILGH